MSATANPTLDPQASHVRRNDPLLQPLQIKHLRLRNRVMSTSHASTLDVGGMPLERYQRYHEEKAKGGIALTMFGGSSMVSADSSWGGGQINVSTDAIIPHLQEFSGRIHGHGAAIMCQISHLGPPRHLRRARTGCPRSAPPRSARRRHRDIPREMDRNDIDRIIRHYADAADALQGGRAGRGRDGDRRPPDRPVPLPPHQPAAPTSFGGSTANRARFGIMVHEAIRRRVGDQFLVGIRFVVDEDAEDGIGFDECVRLARLIEAEGPPRLLQRHLRPHGHRPGPVRAQHARHVPAAHALPVARVGAFKRAHPACRCSTPPASRTSPPPATPIAEGLLDMVAMTRAHMADPQIVNKLMRGEEERIRPCVGASYCMYKKTNCIHNPATGREQAMPQVIQRAAAAGPPRRRRRRRGPAGLEAARVAAERGHRRGAVRGRAPPRRPAAARNARATWRRDLVAIVDWRAAELGRLGVDVRLDRWATAEDVLAEQPDVQSIVATGGLPSDTSWLDGGEHCSHHLGRARQRGRGQGRRADLRRHRAGTRR